MSLLERIKRSRIIPVLPSGKDVDPLADALFDGGLTCIALPLGGNSALDSVRRLASRRELVVGQTAAWESSPKSAGPLSIQYCANDATVRCL